MFVGTTLIVSFVFIALAISRKNHGAALGILILSSLIWPESLRFPLFLIQMSAPRAVALIMIIKFMFFSNRKIKFNKVDTIVILLWVWIVTANVLADADFKQIKGLIGSGLDTVLMYFAARYSIQSKEDIVGLYKWLSISALIMCIAGLYEAITWSTPYQKLIGGSHRIHGYSEIRYGFLRAQASTQISIYFGMAMLMITGIIWAARGYVSKKRVKFTLIVSTLATLSSFSSGPWLGLVLLISLNLLYFKKILIKPLIYMMFLIMFLLELLSNRHFYHLIDYLAIDSNSAWYRTRLMEIAISQVHEYWLYGVGGNWPHHWANLLDGREQIDVVNHFIITALYGGILAFFLYLSTHIVAINIAIKTQRKTQDENIKKLLFGLVVIILAIDFSSLSVGLFSVPLIISNILLGIIMSVSSIKKTTT